MCFPCALNANTLLIQFNIYFCHKQHAAIECKGGFLACIITICPGLTTLNQDTIIIFPLLDILYWEVMPSLRAESWQSAGTLALECSATLQWFSHLTRKTKKNSHGKGRAGWSHKETGAVRAPHSPSPPQALHKHICLSLTEAPGHQLTNIVPSHRSQSRDKHVGDKRVISIEETSIRYNWLCLSLFCCQKEDIKYYLDSLHLLSIIFFPLTTQIKCINANGKTFLISALLFGAGLQFLLQVSFFLRDQGQFYFAFYSVCKPAHCWPHFCRPFQMRAALVAKASLASLTFSGVPVSEMNGLTRKCADNKERNGCVWQNTHTHTSPKQYKSKETEKKNQNQNTVNALSKTDKSLSK